MEEELIAKLKSHEATIGVVGLGYVGLPLVLRFMEVNLPVIGFDIDESKVLQLNEGASFINHISPESIQTARANGFYATSKLSEIELCDAIIICVPTPLNKNREPDLSYITSTMESLTPYFRRGQVLSLESTTYPGTTAEVLLPYLLKKGFDVGKDYFLVYSPEREDPGNPDYDTKTIPKVVGGHTQACCTVGRTLYEQAIELVVPVSSTQTAEMTKLLENIHRAVNIGLVNEMKIVADKMGIDIHEVIRTAATKPFGFTAYYPGPGLGGHCIPIDPFYLTWKAREFDVNTKFIELAGEINSSMPDYVIAKTVQALNDKEKSVKGSQILILGLAYKKNVDDRRESPSLVLIEKLQARGATLAYSDPYVPIFSKMRKYNFKMKSVNLNPKSLASYDCAILATNHDDFDYEQILEFSQMVIDTRGVYTNSHPKVIKA